MIEEKETYQELANRNHLNIDGYKRLVKLLNGEIKDFKTKRTDLITHDDKAVKRLKRLGRDTPNSVIVHGKELIEGTKDYDLYMNGDY